MATKKPAPKAAKPKVPAKKAAAKKAPNKAPAKKVPAKPTLTPARVAAHAKGRAKREDEGRPSKWKPEFVELAYKFCLMGATDKRLGEFFDVCLIDTAPSLGVAMTAAVLTADYMLSPIEMEAYSLQGMKKMVAVISNLRKQNPKLRFLGMVPNKVDARKPRHVNNLATLQQAYPQLILPFSIGARDSIAEALGEQMPVWKIKKTAARKATQEVRALADYVFTKMEIAQ